MIDENTITKNVFMKSEANNMTQENMKYVK